MLRAAFFPIYTLNVLMIHTYAKSHNHFPHIETISMASIDVALGKHALEDAVLPQRKRIKLSELPLTPAQRSTIDGLVLTIKKKGDFDTLRKKIWARFESVSSILN